MEIVGNIYKGNKQAGRIYSKDGICPTLSAMEGGNTEPKIIERETPMKGNYTEPRICTMVGRDPNNPKSRKKSDGYVQMLEIGDDVSNTLTSVQKDNSVAEPNENSEPLRIPQATKQGYVEVQPGGLFDMSYPESKSRRGRVQEGGTVSPTLMESGKGSCLYEGKVEQSYRIRKLTPKECFRLMGVSEGDIEKIQNSGVSQRQQYKMAGNSIVVDVLEHIFRKLFVDTGQESQQLLLF